MNDDVLMGLRQDPPREFAARLRENLRASEAETPLGGGPGRRSAAGRGGGWPARRAAAWAALVVMIAGAFAIPAVRVSAQSFLSLFRVVNFVAVPVDRQRVESLEQLDLPQLIGEHVVVLQDPGGPMPVASLEQASQAARMDVRVPAWLPDGARIIEMAVAGERVVQVRADGTRLQQVMDALGIRDLRVPEGLNGQTATIRVPPVVMVRWEHGRFTRLFQARSPEVAMPDAVDLAALGEIGLRILGLSADEAHQFAQAVDWKTTLLVPMPPNATSVRQVNISGSPGLAIQHRPEGASPTNTVLWSRGDRVFALMSIQGMPEVMQMAQSIP